MKKRRVDLFDVIDDMVDLEGEELDTNEFTATLGKAYKVILIIALGVCIGMAFMFFEVFQAVDVSVICFVCAALCLLLLPTVFSYRCKIDNFSITEEFFILCFKRKSRVNWEDIEYQLVKKDEYGRIVEVRFLSGEKQKLFAFDRATVGFANIVRMAKRKKIKIVKQ